MDIKEIISKSDYILTFGSFLARDNIEIQEAIIEAIAKNNAQFIYMHPIDNIDLKVYYTQFIKYEVGSEEGVASLLLETFVKESNEKIESFIEDLDIGYISAESSAGEEEFEEAALKGNSKNAKTLIVGRDVFTHERAENIIKILSIINRYSDFNVVSLEPQYNEIIEKTLDDELEEIQELDSYNGTIIYRVYGEEDDSTLVGSESFARVAKVTDGDEIFINNKLDKFKRVFKIDKNLMGTVALCNMKSDDTSSLSEGYRYKQVKIEKVDA
ncbi:hypothetical protein CRV08_12125 [Halarcobacter ebronensis]|uniref:Uncharacterized protein n=1 Tax=Halarcobacter ebronensis TaxID=1462615 RepID=A0A4Q0Y981_9BACT|nr:hypothetical protein [Halarcobacter ebronensis]RXJ66807.1 hypothetical protein CRV08_12125 [Halarcobacter ebronensis]